MIELITVAIFSALIWFFLKARKKASLNTAVKNAPESVKSADNNIAAPADEAVKVASTLETQPVAQAVAVENKPVIVQTTVSLKNSLLPQDSMLKRHYLTHVHAMISSLSSARPTDSALSRHYDTQITANIERCLSDEAAMEQLIANYADYQKTPTCPVAISQTIAINEPQTAIETASESPTVVTQQQISKVPEDSMLRRHYLTQLYAQVAVTLPARPTDATLRRHYDALLEDKVKNQLHK